MNPRRHFPTLFVLLASIAYSLVKANHFGWGALPYSDAELIADGIGVVIMSIAVVVFVLVENKDKPQQESPNRTAGGRTEAGCTVYSVAARE